MADLQLLAVSSKIVYYVVLVAVLCAGVAYVVASVVSERKHHRT
jgi:hypothetical protein